MATPTLVIRRDSRTITIREDRRTLTIGTVGVASGGGSGVSIYATAAELEAATADDGTIAYAEDTDVFYNRISGAWVLELADSAPAAVGTAAVGTSNQAAREDHVHAHGDQLGGSLHALVIAAGAAGFMSGADKTALDALPASITAEAASRVAGDATNATAISAEASTRAAADTTLTSAISSEATTRANADTALSASIASEASTRASADTALSGSISTVASDLSTHAADSTIHHELADAAPPAIGAAAVGTSPQAAREDHVHAHGDQLGGSLHAVAIAAGAAGFLSGSDKSKLDGVAASAAALTSSAPDNVTKAAAVVGVATTAARADHKHDITTAAPSSVGTANSEGSASSLARSDHVHNHGAQSDGSLHAAAIAAGASGFMTGADKTKLDGIAASAAALTSAAPENVTKAAAAVGVAATAARADHKHDITTAAPSSVAAANSEGSASSLARSDHVHNHGAQTDGTMHAVAVASGAAGFLSGADKAKLDGIEAGATSDSGKHAIELEIDGGGAVIEAGGTYYLRVPWTGTITRWDLGADRSGSIVIDVWKDTYANFPPTVADTIAGSEKPTLASQQKNQDTSLSTWTVAVTAGDWVAFYVESADLVQRVHLCVEMTE